MNKGLYDELTEHTAKVIGETADLLQQLQRATDEHRRILERQAELIRRLRVELKEVE